MSQGDAEDPKRVWSVANSKFFEHMDDEVPGYGENAKIMYSLHHQKDFMQTGSDHKIQGCSHLIRHTTEDEDLSASLPNAAKLPARRIDLLATTGRVSSAEKAKSPSPLRRAMSKLKNKLKVDSPAGSMQRQSQSLYVPEEAAGLNY